MNKKCSSCGEVKPFTDFHKHKNKKNGIATVCMGCSRDIKIKYRNTEYGYMKDKYILMCRKNRSHKCLLTFEEFLTSWEKHKSIYGMKSAWGPGVHNLEQHQPMTMIYLGNGQKGKPGNIKGSKNIMSNLSVDRLDSRKDYTAQNIIFICSDENRRKNNSSYEDCKIQMRLHKERFKNEKK